MKKDLKPTGKDRNEKNEMEKDESKKREDLD